MFMMFMMFIIFMDIHFVCLFVMLLIDVYVYAM